MRDIFLYLKFLKDLSLDWSNTFECCKEACSEFFKWVWFFSFATCLHNSVFFMDSVSSFFHTWQLFHPWYFAQKLTLLLVSAAISLICFSSSSTHIIFFSYFPLHFSQVCIYLHFHLIKADFEAAPYMWRLILFSPVIFLR